MKAIEDVHYLASAVKMRSSTTKEYIEVIEEVKDKTDKMNDDQLEIWGDVL